MDNNEIHDPLGDAVNRLFGLSYLFPYQRLVITNILEAAQALGIPVNWPGQSEINYDCKAENITIKEEFSDRETSGRQIVILPTGAGKSLCFQLPAMLIGGITLVIYPILSLMADQERSLREKGFAPVVLRGGQSKEERNEIWGKLSNGLSRFIIANPEILQTEQIKSQIAKISITHIVIDEAHCVSEWGESFRPSYLEIGSIINFLDPPLVTAFTATASSPVLEKIKTFIFGNIGVNQIVGNPDRPNITYYAQGCICRNLAVRDLIIQNARPAIVFCSSRTGTEKIARYLQFEFKEMGFSWFKEIRFYHAGLSKEEKSEIEKWFFNNNEAVLCATCAYGMGVDKADIRTVIHRDCAPSVEAYLQEAGRAGRDDRQSKAYLLWGPEDESSLSRAKIGSDRRRMSALLQYARDTADCRRHSLLALLDYDSLTGNGKEVPENFCCDVCENVSSTELREEKSILNFFRQNKRRFTLDEAVSILAETKSINWSEEDASIAINHLIKTGKLKKIKRLLWKGKITL